MTPCCTCHKKDDLYIYVLCPVGGVLKHGHGDTQELSSLPLPSSSNTYDTLEGFTLDADHRIDSHHDSHQVLGQILFY